MKTDSANACLSRVKIALQVSTPWPDRRQTTVRMEASNSSFFIHYGVEINPDQSDSDLADSGVPSEEPSTGLRLQGSRPVIPPRGSSILIYVTASYTNGSSLADYSSTRSAASAHEPSPEPTEGRRLPIERHLSVLGRRRQQDNVALQRIDSHLTTTARSDVWSDESSSSEDSPLSSEQKAITPPASQTDGGAHNFNNAEIFEAQSGRAPRHAQQPSIPTEVAAQFFEPRPARTENPETENHITQASLAASSRQDSWGTIAAVKDFPSHVASHAPSLRAESQIDESQQRKPATKTLEKSQTFSTLSRWSAEFDQFGDVQEQKVSTKPNSLKPQPEQPSDNVHKHSPISEITDKTDVHGLATVRNEALVETSEHRQAEMDSEDSSEPASDEDSEENPQRAQNATLFHPAQTQQVQQLLQPGQAASNAQIAIQDLKGACCQVDEAVSQLTLEEQMRTQHLRMALKENLCFQQEVNAVIEGVRERDREIARLRDLMPKSQGSLA